MRVLVVSLLGLLPLSGHAENAWQTLAASRIDSVLGYLRAEPKHASDLQHDNLNIWKPSMGAGAQLEVAKNWKLRLDVERYRPKFPGSVGRDNLDTLMLGVQYNLDGG